MSQINAGMIGIGLDIGVGEAQAKLQNFFSQAKEMRDRFVAQGGTNIMPSGAQVGSAAGGNVFAQETERQQLTRARADSRVAEHRISRLQEILSNPANASLANRSQIEADLDVARRQYGAAQGTVASVLAQRQQAATSSRVERSFDLAGLAQQRKAEADEASARVKQERQQTRESERSHREMMAAQGERARLDNDWARFNRSQLPVAQRIAGLRSLLNVTEPRSREALELSQELSGAEREAASGGGAGGATRIGRLLGRALGSARGLAGSAGIGAILAATGSVMHQYYQGQDTQRIYSRRGQEAGLEADLAAIQGAPGGAFGRFLRGHPGFVKGFLGNFSALGQGGKYASDDDQINAIMDAQDALARDRQQSQIALNRRHIQLEGGLNTMRAARYRTHDPVQGRLMGVDIDRQEIMNQRAFGLAELEQERRLASTKFQRDTADQAIRNWQRDTEAMVVNRTVEDSAKRERIGWEEGLARRGQFATGVVAARLRTAQREDVAESVEFGARRVIANETLGPIARWIENRQIDAEERAATRTRVIRQTALRDAVTAERKRAEDRPIEAELMEITNEHLKMSRQAGTQEERHNILQLGRLQLQTALRDTMRRGVAEEVNPAFTAFGVRDQRTEDIRGVFDTIQRERGRMDEEERNPQPSGESAGGAIKDVIQAILGAIRSATILK